MLRRRPTGRTTRSTKRADAAPPAATEHKGPDPAVSMVAMSSSAEAGAPEALAETVSSVIPATATVAAVLRSTVEWVPVNISTVSFLMLEECAGAWNRVPAAAGWLDGIDRRSAGV